MSLTTTGAGPGSPGAAPPSVLLPTQIGTGLLAWWDSDPAYCYSDPAMTIPCGIGDVIERWVDRVNGYLMVYGTTGGTITLQQSGGQYVCRWSTGGSAAFLNNSAVPALTPTGATVGCRYDKSDLTYPDPSQFKFLTTRGDQDSWESYDDGNAYPSAFRNPRIELTGLGVMSGKHNLLYASDAVNFRRSYDGVINTQVAAYSPGDGLWLGIFRADGDLPAVVLYDNALSNANLALLDLYFTSRLP